MEGIFLLVILRAPAIDTDNKQRQVKIASFAKFPRRVE
jgi:hypothetical protein